MKIGIIRETKIPEDNRVALIPEQIIKLKEQFKNSEFYVQSSDIRCYTDNEYKKLGIEVKDDISDCDVFFGIKEAKLSTLIPGKHYFFFGHIAKMQEYNKPLIKKLMADRITFSDYEYLVDEEGKRVCAFGWWAGVVGVYNTLRAYGLKNKLFNLPKPDKNFTLEILEKRLKDISLPPVKLVVTGTGKVSAGAKYTLEKMGIRELGVEQFVKDENINEPCFCVASLKDLVKRKDGNLFDREDFRNNPKLYKSNFERFYKVSDIMVSCHFWAPDQPVYLDYNDLKDKNNKIKVIGDITCDIEGSIKSTVRSSTHADPFFDYNPIKGMEEPAFSENEENITVMAVDTCPNALALDTSRYFGNLLAEKVFPLLLSGDYENPLIMRSTILKDGKLTDRFSYLEDYARG